MVGQMLICLQGRTKFLVNMLPVAKINTKFLSEELKRTIDEVQNSSERFKAMIFEGSWTNHITF